MVRKNSLKLLARTLSAALSLGSTVLFAAPSIPPLRDVTGFAGVALTLPNTATGALYFEGQNLPDGLVIDASSGVISGTPERAGTWESLVVASDDAFVAKQTLSFVLADTPAGAPQISAVANASGKVGTPFTLAISATGNSEPIQVTHLPTGLVWDSATGTIKGTPTALEDGGETDLHPENYLTRQYKVKVAAKNANATAFKWIDIAISRAGAAITGPETIDVELGKPFAAEFSFINNITPSSISFIQFDKTQYNEQWENVSNESLNWLHANDNSGVKPNTFLLSGTPTGQARDLTIILSGIARTHLRIHAPGAVLKTREIVALSGNPLSVALAFDRAIDSVSAENLPAGVTLSSQGLLTGTPTEARTKIVSIVATINGVESSATLRFAVKTDNGAPFTPVANGEIQALKSVGDRIYAGGTFTMLAERTGPIVAFDRTTGERLRTFPYFNGPVHALIGDGTGGYYVGGAFSRVGHSTHRGVVHLNADFSVDENFKADVEPDVVSQNHNQSSYVDVTNISVSSGAVYALLLDGDKLWIGGSFLFVNGVGRTGIAKVSAASGALDVWKKYLAYGVTYSGANVGSGGSIGAVGRVRNIVRYKNDVFVFGIFTSVGHTGPSAYSSLDGVGLLAPNRAYTKTEARDMLARCEREFPYEPAQEHVGAVALDAATGETRPAFSSSAIVNGVQSSIAFSTFQNSWADAAYAVQSGQFLYMAKGGGGIIKFDLAARLIDTGFAPQLTYSGQPYGGACRLQLSGKTLYALPPQGPMYYSINTLSGAVAINYLVSGSGAYGKPAPLAAVLADGDLYYFKSDPDHQRYDVRKFNLSTSTESNWRLSESPNTLGYLSQPFDRAGVAYGISQIGGTPAASFATSDTLIFYGNFTTWDGETRVSLASWDSTTGQLLDWKPSVTKTTQSWGRVTLGNIYTLDANADHVVVTGDFNYANAVMNEKDQYQLINESYGTLDKRRFRNQLAVFSSVTGALEDAQIRPDGTVRCAVLAGGKVYAGGLFSTADELTTGITSNTVILKSTPVSRNCILSLDTTSGKLDSFSTSTDGVVKSMVKDEGKLWVAGGFYTVHGGVSRPGLAAFGDDGVLLSPVFDTGASGGRVLDSIALSDDKSKILVRGGKTQVEDGSRITGLLCFDALLGGNELWSLTGDGFRYRLFDVLSDQQGRIKCFAVRGNKVYIGGSFSKLSSDLSAKRYQFAVVSLGNGSVLPEWENFDPPYCRWDGPNVMINLANSVLFGGAPNMPYGAGNWTTAEAINSVLPDEMGEPGLAERSLTLLQPEILSFTGAASIKSGEAFSLSVALKTNDVVKYVWKRNGAVVLGATGAVYGADAAASDEGGTYTATALTAEGATTSSPLSVVVAAPTPTPSPTITPSPTATPTPTATLTPTASPTPSSTPTPTISPTPTATPTPSPMPTPTPTPTLAPPQIVSGPADAEAYEGDNASFTVEASGSALTYAWFKDNVALPSSNSSTWSLNAVTKADMGRYHVRVSNSGGSVTSEKAALTVFTKSALPVLTATPKSVTQTPGSPVILSVEALGVTPPAGILAAASTLTYQWFHDNVAIAGATGATYTIASLSGSDNGSYTVSVSNGSGTVTSRPAVIKAEAPVPGKLSNMSVRSKAGVNGSPLIVGFVMQGGSKPVLVRAAGPTLTVFGLSGVLADPTLELHGSIGGTDTVLNFNDNWGATTDPIATTFASLGAFAFPSNSLDAAFINAVDGPRTVFARPVSGASLGTVLVEGYDAGAGNTPHFINVSARNYAGEGEDTLIAGFVIDGNTPKSLLIRAVGPGLQPFGISDSLPDPAIELYSTSGKTPVLIATNQTWTEEPGALTAFIQAGAFDLTSGSADAALVVSLPSGNYTANVIAAPGTSGQAIVEVYELP